MGMVRHRNGLFRDSVDAPSIQSQDGTLSNLASGKMSLFMVGLWE